MADDWWRRTGLKENPKLIINLEKMMETDLPDDSELKQAIGQEIIDTIRARTQDENRDINGKKFKKYSPQYVNSLDFKAAGKSSTDVNLTLSGDMLGLMDIVEEGKSTITIGWDDTELALRASGNIEHRDFFGLTEKERQAIQLKFSNEIDNAQSEAELRKEAGEDDDILNLANVNFGLALDLIKATEDKDIAKLKRVNTKNESIVFDFNKAIKRLKK